MAKRLQVEVTIISAQDLKSMGSGCFGGKMSPYPVAWTTSNPRKATAPSAKGQGQNPTWNFKQTFFCEEDSLTKGLESLEVKLWHTRFLKKRFLGTVTVPLSSEYLSDAAKPVTSDVVLPSDKKQGVLNCSVKISEAPAPKPTTYTPYGGGGGDGGGPAGGGDGGGGCGGGCGGCGGG